MSKSFVIIGGSKGIGAGIVDRLLSSQHSVTVLSRTPPSTSISPNLHHVEFDVLSDEIDPDRLPDSIHGLAYCPGSINLRAFRSLSPQTFRDDFELNVVGAVRVLQPLLPQLKRGTPSSVVVFSTVAVSQGLFAHASVAAAKGALEGLARTLACELAPETRVNCIAPALTNTPLASKFFSDPDKARALADKYPLQRTGTVDDIASLAAFLLSEESSWLTGQVIGVDGGMSTLRK